MNAHSVTFRGAVTKLHINGKVLELPARQCKPKVKERKASETLNQRQRNNFELQAWIYGFINLNTPYLRAVKFTSRSDC